MGLRSLLARLASDAPVPVFALAGDHAVDRVRRLRSSGRLELVDSPRAANVLLVAGTIREGLSAAAISAHDSLSHPRATVRWTVGAGSPAAPEPFAQAVLTTDEDPVDAIVRVHRELLTGARPSEPPILPDVDPASWRGVGPYGQGGSGMTGGVPYGRPLADRAKGRDGLTLDELPLRLGPFLSPLPPTLVLDVKLQGDVITGVRVDEPRSAGDAPRRVAGGVPDPFMRALRTPTSIVELELARARSHLAWLSDALLAQGLEALARRAVRLAGHIGPNDAEAVRRFFRAVARTGVLTWSTAGVGLVEAGEVAGSGAGPVARASGLGDDVRCEDPAYSSLGFEPIVHDKCDVASRWRQRLAEAVQSLELSARAGDLVATATGRVESPRGELRAGSHPSARLLALLPRIVEGAEWGDAVAAIVSLDLDLDGVRGSVRDQLEERVG
ncbi:hypothetical protein BH24ACT26_BH24ACT26_05910 [soil metagenome]